MKFLQFITRGSTLAVPYWTTVIKVWLNQRIIDLNSSPLHCYKLSEVFQGPNPEDIYFEICDKCAFQVRFSSMQTPRDLVLSTFFKYHYPRFADLSDSHYILITFSENHLAYIHAVLVISKLYLLFISHWLRLSSPLHISFSRIHRFDA